MGKSQSETLRLEFIAQTENDMKVQKAEMVSEMEIIENDKSLLYQKLIESNNFREKLEENIKSLENAKKANEESHSVTIREKTELEVELKQEKIKLQSLESKLASFEGDCSSNSIKIQELVKENECLK